MREHVAGNACLVKNPGKNEINISSVSRYFDIKKLDFVLKSGVKSGSTGILE